MKNSLFLRRSRPAVLLFGVVALLVLALGFASPASALPPGGAQPNTPGTSSTVSPSTLEPGGTLHFTLRGFPAGEVVSVKIDDGNASTGDQSVQGQGVVHTQRIPGSGTVSGSFVLPQLSEGKHTLRFLASEVVSGQGTKGYTNKSPAFTVSKSAAAATGGSGGSSGSRGGSTGSGTQNVTNERTVTLQGSGQSQQAVSTQAAGSTASTGGVTASQAAVAAPKSAPAATIQPSTDPAQAKEQAEASQAAAAEQSKQAAAAQATAQDLADAKESVKALKADRAANQNGFPWIGTMALTVVVLALLVATWFVARRTGRGTHGA